MLIVASAGVPEQLQHVVPSEVGQLVLVPFEVVQYQRLGWIADTQGLRRDVGSVVGPVWLRSMVIAVRMVVDHRQPDQSYPPLHMLAVPGIGNQGAVLLAAAYYGS